MAQASEGQRRRRADSVAAAGEGCGTHAEASARGVTRRDVLSGLFGRDYFDQRVHEEFALARRSGWPAVLVLADVDHFKRINDSLGHGAGTDPSARGALDDGEPMCAVGVPTHAA